MDGITARHILIGVLAIYAILIGVGYMGTPPGPAPQQVLFRP
jgi:hypothetical protein